MNERRVAITIGCLLSCLFAAPVAAQVAWEGGLRGGLGLAKLRGDTRIFDTTSDGVSTITLVGDVGDFRTAFTGGGFASAKLTDRFALRLEVLFTQKGGKGTVDITVDNVAAGTADFTFKLNYLEIPLLAAWSIPAGEQMTVVLVGGPAVGFKTGAKLRLEAGGIGDEADIGDTVKGTDFGLSAGAGLALKATERTAFLIDGRYTLGLTDFPEGAPGVSLKNGALVFTAGVSFPLGAGSTGP